ncbi:hypothetical protein OnM2_017025 [Erysiphe neolycopersici]|uniref:Uncharacterized protein n=1 Tax=Erysiphe neolycopersici TaxID=212602 RepID=A0A420I4Q3_9PEZI|nr:hypothetical protein OnM2_017025 [Erysiphe neolycopersici]
MSKVVIGKAKAHVSRYTIKPNVSGFTLTRAKQLYEFIPTERRIQGMTLGAFGGVAGFFALYFFGDVPRVQIASSWAVLCERNTSK